MKCERLIKLIKNWYVQVQDEAMAPARMVDFMRAHLGECPVCKADPDVAGEIKRITEIVLPAAKIPKAVRKEEEADGEDFEEYDEAGDEDEDADDEERDTEESDDDLEDDDLDDLDDDDI